MDGDKEGFKRSVLFFFFFFLDVSKLCWQKLPDEVCGRSGESLLHRREFEALRRGTSDHLLAGEFLILAQRHATSVQKRKSTRCLPGSSGYLRGQQMMERPAFGGVAGAFAEANMGQGVKGKCVSVMGVTRRHGNECHQWRFTPSVVTPRCFWCTAVRIALKSPSVPATSRSLSNILVIQRCVCLMQPQKIVLQIFHEVIGDSERF